MDQIDKFLTQGITNFYLLLGHKAFEIKQAIIKYCIKYPDIKLKFFIESEPLGSGGGLLKFKEYFPKTFYFVYCDIFFDINLNKFSCAFLR